MRKGTEGLTKVSPVAKSNFPLMTEQLTKNICRFFGIGSSDAVFVKEQLDLNIREMRRLSRLAAKNKDWQGLERFALALVALHDNLEIVELKDAWQVVKTCSEQRDTQRIAQVVKKTNSILAKLEKTDNSNAESAD